MASKKICSEDNICLGDGKEVDELISCKSNLKFYEQVVFQNCLFGIWKVFSHKNNMLTGD